MMTDVKITLTGNTEQPPCDLPPNWEWAAGERPERYLTVTGSRLVDEQPVSYVMTISLAHLQGVADQLAFLRQVEEELRANLDHLIATTAQKPAS